MALPWRLAGAILAAALSAGLAGCGDWKFPGLGGSQNGAGQRPAVVQGSGQWIIVLQEYEGADRQAQAERLVGALRDLKWSGVGALHDPDVQRSYVYLGMFKLGRDFDDALRKIHAYRDNVGNAPFMAAYRKELPPPDPPAPPEFNLVNAPAGAYWTLQIAHYVDPGPAFPATRLMDLPADWNRKRAAVEACIELRKNGYEAYYYHDPAMSIVTLGLFPAEVCRFIPDPRNPRYEGYDPTTDEYKDKRVRDVRNEVIRGRDGKQDRWFRYNLENGMKVTKVQTLPDGRRVGRAWPSFLVQIPRPGQPAE